MPNGVYCLTSLYTYGLGGWGPIALGGDGHGNMLV